MDRNTTTIDFLVSYELCILNLLGELHTGDAPQFLNHRPIDPRCRASEVQHPPKLRLLSKQMIFIWSKDTQKKKVREIRETHATFFRANLELQDCRRSQLYDVVHVVKLIIVIY
jgi:hypothetical protein